MFVNLNGKVLPLEEARISPHDRGFLLGDGLFETIRFYKGKPFRLDVHMKRLSKGASLLGIPFDLSPGQIRGGLRELMRCNELMEGVARITISRGEGGRGLRFSGKESPTVLLSTFPLSPIPAKVYEEGIRAEPVEVRGRMGDPLGGIKSTSYFGGVWACKKAAESGASEAILLDGQWVVEGGASNIFGVWKKSLKTPPLHPGILPGVTRKVVLEISQRLGLEAMEEDFTLSELLEGDEAFLTNAVIELLPLSRIGDRSVGKGKAGPVTQELLAKYKETVERELGAGNPK